MDIKLGGKYIKVSGPVHSEGPDIGGEVTIKRFYGDTIEVDEFDSFTYGVDYFTENFEPAEDRTTWHPHHDVIVAWAKGAKVQFKFKEEPEEPEGEWRDILNPSFPESLEYRVKPEPDHTEEIAEIEQEMRKLADRLEKLK